MNRRLAVAVGVGLACALVLVDLAATPTRGGPLAELVPGNAVSFPVSAGTPFTYGGLQLRNPGGQPAVLDGVLLEGGSTGLRIETAYVLPVVDTNGELWFSYQRFPPPGLPVERLRDLAGYEIAPRAREPRDAVQVVLILSVMASGRYGFDAIAVDYRVAGRRYRAAFPFALRVRASADSRR